MCEVPFKLLMIKMTYKSVVSKIDQQCLVLLYVPEDEDKRSKVEIQKYSIRDRTLEKAERQTSSQSSRIITHMALQIIKIALSSYLFSESFLLKAAAIQSLLFGGSLNLIWMTRPSRNIELFIPVAVSPL